MKSTIFIALMLGGLFMFQGCKNPCKDVTCLNGGTCDEETGECQCAVGYEGADCGVGINAKFAGTWSVTGPCVNTDTLMMNHQLEIALISGSGDSITLTGIHGSINNVVRGRVNADGLGFEFSKQAVSVFDSFESLSAVISSDYGTINFEYNWYASGATSPTRVCNLICTK